MNSSTQELKSQEINVKILLMGGHEYSVYINSDAPLLQNLIKAVFARTHNKTSDFLGVFQIPINEGRSVLFFSSEHLVGLVTEPPILMQHLPETNPQETTTPAAWENISEPPLQPTNVIPSQYMQIDDFLTIAEKNMLLNYVWQRESEFVSTTTSTGDADYRRSMVLFSFPEFSDMLVNRIKAILPNVFSKFNIPAFPVSEIECQLTSHNDGNYFKIHNDNGGVHTASRVFTYVYYFYREPKPFSGGTLRIYDSKIENNFYVHAESFKYVEPRNNSIVFFPSHYLHEVLPVSCPTKAFADSRFTINGWVRR